jgi:hypothetical protein
MVMPQLEAVERARGTAVPCRAFIGVHGRARSTLCSFPPVTEGITHPKFAIGNAHTSQKAFSVATQAGLPLKMGSPPGNLRYPQPI